MKNMNKTEILMAMVQEINALNNELGFLNIYKNDDDFFDAFFTGDPMELVRAIYSGDYNYNDQYVAFDDSRNLVSYTDCEAEERLKAHEDEIVNKYLSLYNVWYNKSVAGNLNSKK